MKPIFVFVNLFFVTLLMMGCAAKIVQPTQPIAPPVLRYAPLKTNAETMRNHSYVVLVSIDAYRFDFNTKFSPPNLSDIERSGVAAKSMQSVYPSKTFPNHMSIMTGLYPDRHGIVANEFYDPEQSQLYAKADIGSREARWYLGEPLWNTVQKQGLLTASYFWPNADAAIQDMHPNYYLIYKDGVPDEVRVDQVLSWLKLADEIRPHFISLYFSDVDLAGHLYGPESQEMRDAVAHVDVEIGRLRQGLAQLNLPINLIILSDHGISGLEANKLILLDQDPDVANAIAHFLIVGRGPQMQLYLREGEAVHWVKDLKKALLGLVKRVGHMRVFAREEMKSMHYSRTSRSGNLIVVPDLPWLVGLKKSVPSTKGGNHGWDPKESLMHGIFFAEGPGFKPGARLPMLYNIDIQPLVLKLLDLQPSMPVVDGHLKPVQSALTRNTGHGKP